MERVFITGAGVISAIGAGKETTYRSLVEGRSGVGPLCHLKTVHSNLPCGEVGMTDAELKSALGIPASKPMARTTLLGIHAVKEALEQSGIKDLGEAAFVSGTTVGGMDVTERHYKDFLGGDDFNELLSLHTCGSCTDAIAEYFGGFSMVTTTSTACSSAANSMILGANLIKAGMYDVVVAGGSECLTKYHLNGFNSLMILSDETCKPFDANRSGINLGEGAGFLVLESESHAKARNARCIGILDGYGNACDAFHQTASSPEGEGSYLAMSKALEVAGLKPEDIDYINAHGTGTVNNDESESHGMRRLFGDNVPPVSSTKAFTGHTTSASGSIEAVICLIAMEKGFIPVNLNWKEGFEGGIVPETVGQAKKPLKHVLCNSFGFGGNDSSILLSGNEL